MLNEYRVVTHSGHIYVEYRERFSSAAWKRVKAYIYVFYECTECDHSFYTTWGAKRYIRKRVKEQERAFKLEQEKKKSPIVVWGPYP